MKNKFALWLSPEAKRLVENHFQENGCKSQSEFIEKAVRFYIGYLDAERDEVYLPRVLLDVLKGTLGMFGDRIGKLLFKYAVEQNMTNHILAADTDMDVPTYDHLRGRSFREVQETNGQISFRNAVDFQKTV